MGKPLKSRALQSGSLRKSVLGRQGVSVQKRKRLGHTGHFGKVEQVPIERKPAKPGRPEEEAGRSQGKKSKSKFNKFKQGGLAIGDSDGGPAGDAGGMAELHEPQQDSGEAMAGQETQTQRLEGESFSKFMKRLNKETTENLNKHQSKLRKVSEKRKDFLKKRKLEKKEEKKSRKAGWAKHFDQDEAPSADVLEKRLRAEPAFGEQADRPPIIRMSKPMKGLQKQAVAAANSSGGGYIVGGMPALPEVGKAASNRREFEMLRKNAISQYRGMMAKKREEKGMVSIGQL